MSKGLGEIRVEDIFENGNKVYSVHLPHLRPMDDLYVNGEKVVVHKLKKDK